MADVTSGSLSDDMPAGVMADERFDTLMETRGVTIERIVSTGQSSPSDGWYDQTQDEWVVVTQGAASLRIEGESEDRTLSAGDWLFLPAHCRHRVTWTQEDPPTVWLAVHIHPASG